MVKLHEKADLTSVVGEEPKTQEEMEDHIDELCISTGKSKLASVYQSENMTHCIFSAAKQRNGARVTIKYEDDENVGDNFLVNDINVNEHYVTREDIKKPKLKNKKR